MPGGCARHENIGVSRMMDGGWMNGLCHMWKCNILRLDCIGDRSTILCRYARLRSIVFEVFATMVCGVVCVCREGGATNSGSLCTSEELNINITDV